jgi:hypothetical protein
MNAVALAFSTMPTTPTTRKTTTLHQKDDHAAVPLAVESTAPALDAYTCSSGLLAVES